MQALLYSVSQRSFALPIKWPCLSDLHIHQNRSGTWYQGKGGPTPATTQQICRSASPLTARKINILSLFAMDVTGASNGLPRASKIACSTA